MSTTQKELILQGDMLKGLRLQGFFADKTSDRFKAGRPDLRLGKSGVGQLDVELKYIDIEKRRILTENSDDQWRHVPPTYHEIDYGLKKIQWLKIKEMNEHGMPTVCLVFVECLDIFFVTTLLRDTLPPLARCVKKLPQPEIIDGHQLIKTAMEHLHDIGYT